MTNIAKNEPLGIIAGDYVQWQRSFSDYPASAGWTLSYALRNAAGKIDINGALVTASGDDYLVTLPVATTTAYTSGTYDWQAYVTNGSQRYLVDTGTLKVKPNFAALNTYDARDHTKKVLDSIEAVLENRATMDQEEYTIGGRSLKRTPVMELVKLRKFYKAEYASLQNSERLRNGLGAPNRILVRL